MEVKWDAEYFRLQFKKLEDYVKNDLEVIFSQRYLNNFLNKIKNKFHF